MAENKDQSIEGINNCANIFYCRSLYMCLGSAAENKNNQIAKHIALYTTEYILDED